MVTRHRALSLLRISRLRSLLEMKTKVIDVHEVRRLHSQNRRSGERFALASADPAMITETSIDHVKIPVSAVTRIGACHTGLARTAAVPLFAPARQFFGSRLPDRG